MLGSALTGTTSINTLPALSIQSLRASATLSAISSGHSIKYSNYLASMSVHTYFLTLSCKLGLYLIQY